MSDEEISEAMDTAAEVLAEADEGNDGAGEDAEDSYQYEAPEE